jgi:ribosomal protein L24
VTSLFCRFEQSEKSPGRPLADARGDKKRVARGDKKGARGDKKGVARGDKKRVARGDKKGARGDKIKWMGLTKWAQAEGLMATSNRLSLTKPS